MSGTPFEPGDVVLVPFPFTDLSAAKTRPALVVSSAAFNAGSPDVIVCGITSNLANASRSVLIADDDLSDGKLPKPSRVKVEKIATLRQDIVRKRVGRLKRGVMEQVRKELVGLFQ